MNTLENSSVKNLVRGKILVEKAIQSFKKLQFCEKHYGTCGKSQFRIVNQNQRKTGELIWETSTGCRERQKSYVDVFFSREMLFSCHKTSDCSIDQTL